MDAVEGPEVGRRAAVLESALGTFARDGYRATSMTTVAREAHISRPGLYFLFASKEALFREAASHVVLGDLAAVETLLADPAVPLRDRLLAAFDRWAGRYVGPLARDVPGLVADNGSLLDASAADAPTRFSALLGRALVGAVGDPEAVARTLESVSVGLKHQVDARPDYLDRLAAAIALLVPGRARGADGG